MKNILIISVSPQAAALCHSLALAYAKGARAAGHKVEMLVLSELAFDPILHDGYHTIQALEPDLLKAQEMIKVADHLVFAYPSWWGSVPALLKGFLDRVFLPGFAFKYKPNSPMWDKLLKGKSARILLTMDSPWIWNFLVYHSANVHQIKNATLQYSGIKPVKVSIFGQVRFSKPEKRTAWMQQVEELGSKAK